MEALAEVRGLQEDNMDLMRKAAGGAMQTIKMKDGKLQMDSFTASAIMQVYDKVNPANKKKIETIINTGKKNQIMKLQSMAMKAIKSEYGEETELEEGRMKELHGYIAQGKSAEWIAKKMGVDAKTIKALMDGYGEVDEASAYAIGRRAGEDAMRAMRKGKKEVDPADVDIDASDADIKAASKNILAQMRKAVSLGGRFHVEFLENKKV